MSLYLVKRPIRLLQLGRNLELQHWISTSKLIWVAQDEVLTNLETLVHLFLGNSDILVKQQKYNGGGFPRNFLISISFCQAEDNLEIERKAPSMIVLKKTNILVAKRTKIFQNHNFKRSAPNSVAHSNLFNHFKFHFGCVGCLWRKC